MTPATPVIRPGPRLPVIASHTAALVLIIASALKAWALATGAHPPTPGGSLGPAIILIELGTGGWLLARPRSTAALAFAAGLFLVFSIANARALLDGPPLASCGCFGRLAVTPALTPRLDACVLGLLATALIRVSPRGKKDSQ
jgi:hypothetical protein